MAGYSENFHNCVSSELFPSPPHLATIFFNLNFKWKKNKHFICFFHILEEILKIISRNNPSENYIEKLERKITSGEKNYIDVCLLIFN